MLILLDAGHYRDGQFLDVGRFDLAAQNAFDLYPHGFFYLAFGLAVGNG